MANTLSNLSIKWKLVAFTSCLMAVIAIATLWMFPRYLGESLRDGWRAKIDAVSSMLAASLEPAVQLQQVSEEDEMFVGAKRDKDLVAIRVEDMSGVKLAGAERSDDQVAVEDLVAGEAWIGGFDGEYLQAAKLIEAEGAPIGVLRLTYSLGSYHDKEANIWWIGSLMALAIYLIGSAISYFLGNRLTRPMREMTDSFKAMAEGQLRQATLRADTDDEVGQLSGAYNRLLSQLKALSSHAQRISEGDLTQDLETSGDLADAFRAMSGALATMIAQGEALAGTIDERSSEILATAKEQEAGAAQQAATVSEVTATMGELAATARQIASNAENVTAATENASTIVNQGRSALSSLAESISNIQSGNRTINDNIVQLNRHVQQIGGIIDIINDIADKSDLLALNAALEGTKAGEAGKGFLLVAAEMRRLAENVFQSTAEIKQLIGEVTEASNSTVMATESGMKATAEGVDRARETEAVFDQIVQSMEETTRASKQISVATQQQHTGTDQIVSAMGEVSEVSQQSLEGITHTTRSVSELSNTASELRGMLRRYRVS